MNAALAAQCGTTMNIGLIDVDSNHNRKKWGATVFPNLALAKLSAWHKKRGDNVEWYTPFSYYDVVYMAKVFTYTPDYGYVIDNADEIVKGGTGYDVNSALPDEVDRLQPDYTIYPDVPKDYAYGFLTRGCPNKCFWCVVPKKEGGGEALYGRGRDSHREPPKTRPDGQQYPCCGGLCRGAV